MPLHHGPTKGGPSERAKFREWYNRTLASYREHFGDDPPRDIWPPTRERFRPRAERRLDLATHFVIPKRTCYRLLAVALGTLVLAGCSLSERGAEFLTALLTLGAVFVLIAVLFSKRGKGGCGGAGGCGGTGSNNRGGDSGCASGCGGGGGCGGGCGGG
jgi:hypothetical protein